MPISPVNRSSSTNPMKSAWKTGVKSQAIKLSGSAPGDDGTSGGCGVTDGLAVAAAPSPPPQATAISATSASSVMRPALRRIRFIAALIEPDPIRQR